MKQCIVPTTTSWGGRGANARMAGIIARAAGTCGSAGGIRGASAAFGLRGWRADEAGFWYGGHGGCANSPNTLMHIYTHIYIYIYMYVYINYRLPSARGHANI